MFKIFPECKFINQPAIVLPIDESHFLNETNLFLDNSGFELSPLEQLYYSANNIPVLKYRHGNPLGAVNLKWFMKSSGMNFILDHSCCLSRLEYKDKAKDQIIEISKQHPQLLDLLLIKPKWGIDFRLDYLDNEIMMEILHLEEDFDSINDAEEMKEWVEQKILETDWQDLVIQLKQTAPQWQSIKDESSQRRWKARLWGLPEEHISKLFCFD